jgi:thioesterase domain-containing protein
MAMNTDDLEALWHREFPLARAMAVEVRSWQDGVLEVAAPIAHNHNVHGTGFAGSQYALAALCGWGALRLRLADLDIDASILTTAGSIRFDAPVRGELVARCDLAPVASLFARLAIDGRAVFELECRVGDDVTPTCTRYTGSYPVRLDR